MMHEESAGTTRKVRLEPADRSKDLLPWRRAENMPHCSLYWMPVATFPASHAEKIWLLEFTTSLGARLKNEFEVEPWVFLQYKTANTVHDDFIRRSREFMPLMGLGRQPGAPIPTFPTKEELQAAIDAKRTIDVNKYTADYAYWFLNRSNLPQRQLFQTLGGMTILYRKPDPKAKPPELTIPPRYKDHELFKSVDVHGLLAGACAMQDEFLKQSKVAFGAGLEKNIEAEFIPFILPLLDSQDFFKLSTDEIKTHFDLFEVYLRESPADRGMILASKRNLDALLMEIVKELQERADRDGAKVRK